MNTTTASKLESFAELIKKQTMERLNSEGLNTNGCNDIQTRVVEGKKYAKVDIGPHGQWSGRYMVNSSGEIFGIKAYGVIHTGHYYGTLDTINDWNWGNYTAHRIK